jgi:cytochrome c2
MNEHAGNAQLDARKEKLPVIRFCHRTVSGWLAVGALSLPLLSSAVAAPPPKKPAAKGNAAAGKTAFPKEGCSGCHKTKDHKTGTAGPDLSQIGKKSTAAKIAAYTRKPKAGSVMPAFKGPQATLDNLVAYLMTQK